MAKASWKVMTGAAVALWLLGAASIATGQVGRWGARGWYDGQAPEQYRLTQEQALKVEEIESIYEQKLIPLEKHLESARIELDVAVTAQPEPNES